MTDPLSFPSTTARHALPLLFAGQAQKEVTVNAAHALIDMLLQPAVSGELAAPPADPGDGDCWLIAEHATGIFAGKHGYLAAFQAGTWQFAAPVDGMRVFDRSTGQLLLFREHWLRAAQPAEPTGGSLVDSESRAAIVAILHLLRTTGILPSE